MNPVTVVVTVLIEVNIPAISDTNIMKTLKYSSTTIICGAITPAIFTKRLFRYVAGLRISVIARTAPEFPSQKASPVTFSVPSSFPTMPFARSILATAVFLAACLFSLVICFFVVFIREPFSASVRLKTAVLWSTPSSLPFVPVPLFPAASFISFDFRNRLNSLIFAVCLLADREAALLNAKSTFADATSPSSLENREASSAAKERA